MNSRIVMASLFVELIQVAIGTRQELSKIPSENDWQQIYDTAAKQSLVGIVFSAIEILNRKDNSIKPPMMLFYNWLGEVQLIEKQNKDLSEATILVSKFFKDDGLRSCVLKGQGVARMYDGSLSLRRQSGDIDIWVEGKRDDTLKFLKDKQVNTGKAVIHHVDASIIEGVETEVHFLPSYTYDFLRYRKYKKLFKEEANQQFSHFDERLGFAYPTNRFNTVYLMMHIFRHVFHEGIGLRQLMDYYFVLIHLTEDERKWAYNKLKWLGLGKVTSAVMYVMETVFLMDDKYLLCKPTDKTGEYLLEEIFAGGNFGKYGEQYETAHSGSGLKLYLRNLKRLGKVYTLCPSEVLWAPIWKPTHWLWRKWKGYV